LLLTKERIVESKAVAIYSALIGGYENPVVQPHAAELGMDMFMFTDRPEALVGTGWTPVEVDPYFPTDPVRSARYLKTIGHPLLDDYEATIWIDNRVVLQPEAKDLLALMGDKDALVPVHSYRSTLKAEFVEVIASGYDDPARVRSTYEIVCASGVDIDTPPLWTGILVRRRTPGVAAAMRRWMDIILLGSRRDQLSVLAALRSVELNYQSLSIDNVESPYHRWVSGSGLNRRKAVQRWKPAHRSLGLRVADVVRSRHLTRRAARLLERAGIPLPALDVRGAARPSSAVHATTSSTAGGS